MAGYLDLLTKKVGGIPVWIIAVVAGGGVAAVYLLRAHNAVNNANSDTANPVVDSSGADPYSGLDTQDYTDPAMLAGLSTGYGGAGLPGGSTGSLFYGGNPPSAIPPDYRMDPALLARLNHIATVNVGQQKAINALKARNAKLAREHSNPIRR